MKIKRLFAALLVLLLVAGMIPATPARAAADTTGTLGHYDALEMSITNPFTLTYVDGNGNTQTGYIQALAWYYIDTPENIVYCLEPTKGTVPGAADGATGVGFEGRGDGSVGDIAWGKLSEDQQRALGLTLLYGAPNMLWDSSWGITNSPDNPNIGYRHATQVLLWEIIAGIRTCTRESGYVATGNGYVGSSIFYDNCVGQCVGSDGTDYFLKGYSYIVSCLRTHEDVPSFADKVYLEAPTIEVNGSTTTVTDTNGVLSRFNFTNTDNVTFTKNGNKLTITTNGAIDENQVYTSQAQFPSATASTYQFWYKYDYGQVTFKLDSPCNLAHDPIPAYFKLSNSGTATMKKTTTAPGGDVAGYCFKIYNWDTNTTWYGKSDSSGKIFVTDSAYSANNGYTFEGLTDGNYSFLEVLSVKGKEKVFPDKWTIKVTNGEGAVTHNKTYTSEIAEDANGDARLGTSSAKIAISGLSGGGSMTMTINNAPETGKLVIKKNTNTGSNLGDWEFKVYTDSALKNLYGTYKTNGSGTITIEDVPIGTYYIKETGSSNSYWSCDTETKTATVESGKTATVTVKNNHYGKIKVVKTSNTNENANWVFDIKDASGNIVETLTTGPDGSATSKNLAPGKYTVTERSSNDTYWECDVSPKSVTVVAGETKTATINNTHYGKIKVTKTSNTNENANWTFDIKDASGNIVDTVTTGANGTATSKNLLPGKYTVTERGVDDPYWECDVTANDVTVAAGSTAAVTVNNVHYGRIRVVKTSNTGENSGWIFDIADSEGNIVATLETDQDGYAVSENLPLGAYTVTERGLDDSFWECDIEPKSVTLIAGKTVDVPVHNEHYGRIHVFKTTNTGENSDWVFDIKDAEGNILETITTDKNGHATPGNLPLGQYTVTERGVDDPYWACDVNVKDAIVEAGKVTDVGAHNVHYGKMRIVKTMDTDGPVSGWEFRITRLSDNEDMGIYTSEEDGTITTKNLMPGDYLVEELIPENSLYYCKTENPVTITVTEGQTIDVAFTNALRPARVVIEKVDFLGRHLAGAKFLLEWSEDGSTWTPVTYSAEEDVVKGTCGTEGITDGWLVTDESGLISFENLYPSVKYRITELEAPEGYILLKEPIYIDEFPVKDLTVEKTVHNSKGYILPTTGVDSSFDLISGGVLLTMTAMAAFALYMYVNKKKCKKE